MKTYQVEIQNLKCGGCANTIKNGLLEIKGVSSVSVNEETSIVEMNLDGENLVPQVHQELDSLGYPIVGDENSIGKKAKSYVSCAIGKFS